jgi:hypothetical protein
MTFFRVIFQRSRLPLLLVLCILALTTIVVYADDTLRPQAAVTIIGAPDAAVTGKLAVGTATPGNKALTVAGVIDFLGAGTVSNYFTQGPGNNMQIRTNVSETNTIDDFTKSQWNMVMGAAIDQFSIRRSPAGGAYNEDALFFIDGATGDVGIAQVDTSNGAAIPFTPQARLDVETDTGDAIRGISTATSGSSYGVYGRSYSTEGRGVYAWASATSGTTYGVRGDNSSTSGYGVYGLANATSGATHGVIGLSYSTSGIGVAGWAMATDGAGIGIYGRSYSTSGRGVSGWNSSTSGIAYGVYGLSSSTAGSGVFGTATAASGGTYGVFGQSASTSGRGVYGVAAATSGYTYGVRGDSSSSDGYGLFGYASATSGTTYGVYGRNESATGYGVYGTANATSGLTYGVYGKSDSISGRGVYGWASATSGTNYGVYGVSNSASGYDFYAAGPGTNYGPFTGAHEVRLSDSFPQEIKAGMIVSATGEAQVRQANDGDVEISSTLPTVRLADTANDKAVFGALVAEVTLPEDHWYLAEGNERFASVNALGEGRVWISNLNGEIEVGDYITTSVLPGYGQLQNDDLLHSYTLGKATETVDWEAVTETVEYNGQEYKVYLMAVVYTSG